MFGFSFAPKGWAFCNGQTLAISQNPALFSLLGTTFGGDGRSTFSLPNLQGYVPMGAGGNNVVGAILGLSAITLTQTNLPAHLHAISDPGHAHTYSGIATTGTSTVFQSTSSGNNVYHKGTATTSVVPTGIMGTTNTGNSTPVSVMQPSSVTNFCIALQGIFPSPNMDTKDVWLAFRMHQDQNQQ